jgi:hypothetical protein
MSSHRKNEFESYAPELRTQLLEMAPEWIKAA